MASLLARSYFPWPLDLTCRILAAGAKCFFLLKFLTAATPKITAHTNCALSSDMSCRDSAATSVCSGLLKSFTAEIKH